MIPKVKSLIDMIFESSSDSYTKSETDAKVDVKANSSDVYNKTETDTKMNAKQDKLTAGTNITIANNTISAKDTTYSTATSSTDGLMSKEDKQKLDSLSNYDDITIKEEINTKVNISDVVDNLTRTDTDKPLSANQGKLLKDSLNNIGAISQAYRGDGNKDTFTVTLKGYKDGYRLVLVLGFNLLSVVHYDSNKVQNYLNLGHNKISSATVNNVNGDDVNITFNLSSTSWGGIRLLVFP